ncbi:MAG TPA: YvcK family protein [Clostridiaceae bacterium]|mgnify:CR=1 FL=1|nr:YvcK family protein [Clostridiaceae bacterium]
MRSLKWFQIALRFKKWLFGGVLGLLLLIASLVVLLKNSDISPLRWGISLLLAILGIYGILICFRKIFIKFVNVYSNAIMKKPSNVGEIGDIIYRRKILSAGARVVTIGGGTGISTLLRGLKAYTSNITAIITVADDGGGSGILRNDLGILPPGDIRNCMLALAETEPVLEKLLAYRFPEGSLKGQCFGNLFLAAMSGISDSFKQAVKHMGEVLAITGRIYPVTEDNIYLVAELEDGTQIRGESKIGSHNLTHPGKIKKIMLNKESVAPVKEAIDAIYEADVIVLGPGSLYTSIIPNLLVEGVAKAIVESRGIKVYVCNIMTQPGETENYTAGDHIEAIYSHVGKPFIDICIANNGKIKPGILRKYKNDGSNPVYIDYQVIKKLGVGLIEKDLVKISKDLIRHDSQLLSQTIMELTKFH